ncbi:arylamine N-acetyltransferase family protein [Rufibacter latericius]|uniref:Arylamine N-acetyltransferase n=1 Tax=Rufibacter latericius TaxID=2487040 RepID=A0A3M9MTX8_9BACT|nr:arylamine N-acetyltransferase [Rufibacter latericius]RNI28984.1 arylamine N-acetyltransferase [Rufibacter latericius]
MKSTTPIAPEKTFFKIKKDGIDLERYFKRINYTGALSPTVETLQQLHYQHAVSIPFENLNPFLKQPVPLDMESLQRKLVEENRGGYCFEQNLLFAEVLRSLGFQVRGLAARVLWNVPAGVTTARGHMLLLVQAEGEAFLADVGFGGLTLTAPVKLYEQKEQQTPHETFRVVPVEDEFVLQAKIQGNWKPLYRIGLQEQFTPDYEMANWFTSTHPRSPFVNGLMFAKTTPEARYGLRNYELSIHYTNGITEKQVLSNPGQVKTVIEEVFKIPLPTTQELDQALHLIMQPLD